MTFGQLGKLIELKKQGFSDIQTNLIADPMTQAIGGAVLLMNAEGIIIRVNPDATVETPVAWGPLAA